MLQCTPHAIIDSNLHATKPNFASTINERVAALTEHFVLPYY